jgi:hypothetical protein
MHLLGLAMRHHLRTHNTKHRTPVDLKPGLWRDAVACGQDLPIDPETVGAANGRALIEDA